MLQQYKKLGSVGFRKLVLGYQDAFSISFSKTSKYIGPNTENEKHRLTFWIGGEENK